MIKNIALLSLGVVALGAASPRNSQPQLAAYSDPRYGFTLRPPQFAAAKQAPVVLAMFANEAQNGHTSGVSVFVQPTQTNLESYQQVRLGEMRESGATDVITTRRKVAGYDALCQEYVSGTPELRQRQIWLTVVRPDHLLHVVATAHADDFAAQEKCLRACLESLDFPK